jgi:hypothetical protein
MVDDGRMNIENKISPQGVLLENCKLMDSDLLQDYLAGSLFTQDIFSP